MHQTPSVKSVAPHGPIKLPRQQLRDVLATWLDEAMQRGGWSPGTLQGKSGVTRQAISALRAGEGADPPEDQTIAKLTRAMDLPIPRIAVLDADGNPRPDWVAPDDPASEVAMRVARAVARAVHETIEKNELWYPGRGLRDLIASLHHLAADFTDRGIDTADIGSAIRFLEDKLRAGGKPPAAPPADPGGGGS